MWPRMELGSTLSFHQGRSVVTERYLLDDAPDLSCKDSIAITPWTVARCLVNIAALAVISHAWVDPFDPALAIFP